MAIRLVSFATIKAVLGLEQVEAEYANLAVILDDIQYAFESYIKAELESMSRTETIHVGSSPTTLIPLNALPITAITSITVDGNVDSGAKLTNGGVKLSSPVTNVPVVTTYTGGYVDTDAIPKQMNYAAMLQVVHLFNRLPTPGATTVSTDGGTTVYPELNLLKEVKRNLNKFRHPMKMGV